MPHQRLVAILGARAADEDYGRKRAAVFGPREGARQDMAAVRVGIADLFDAVGERLLGVLGSGRARRFLRRHPFERQGERVARLGERAVERLAVVRQGALVGTGDHRHRHRDRRSGDGRGGDRDGGVALIDRVHDRTQRTVLGGDIKAHSELDPAEIECAHPVADEGRRVGVLSGRGASQGRQGDGYADQETPHSRCPWARGLRIRFLACQAVFFMIVFRD